MHHAMLSTVRTRKSVLTVHGQNHGPSLVIGWQPDTLLHLYLEQGIASRHSPERWAARSLRDQRNLETLRIVANRAINLVWENSGTSSGLKMIPWLRRGSMQRRRLQHILNSAPNPCFDDRYCYALEQEMKIDNSLSETPWSISNIAIPAPLCFFSFLSHAESLGLVEVPCHTGRTP